MIKVSLKLCILNWQLIAWEYTPKLRRKQILQKIILNYPSGRSGFALLLLRLTLGIICVLQGINYLADYRTAPLSIWIIAVFFILCGVFVTCGLMTSIAAFIIFTGIILITLNIIPAMPNNLFLPTIPVIYSSVTAIAITLIGPGSLSFDAMLFGRREIIIPSRNNPQ